MYQWIKDLRLRRRLAADYFFANFAHQAYMTEKKWWWWWLHLFHAIIYNIWFVSADKKLTQDNASHPGCWVWNIKNVLLCCVTTGARASQRPSLHTLDVDDAVNSIFTLGLHGLIHFMSCVSQWRIKSGCKHGLSVKTADKATQAWTALGEITSSRGPNGIWPCVCYSLCVCVYWNI